MSQKTGLLALKNLKNKNTKKIKNLKFKEPLSVIPIKTERNDHHFIILNFKFYDANLKERGQGAYKKLIKLVNTYQGSSLRLINIICALAFF